MNSDSSHLVKWDLAVHRSWSPLYFLGGGRTAEPFPPFDVELSVTFDDNDAALSFERRVGEILEEMS